MILIVVQLWHIFYSCILRNEQIPAWFQLIYYTAICNDQLSNCTAREVEQFTRHVNVARYSYNQIQLLGLLEDNVAIYNTYFIEAWWHIHVSENVVTFGTPLLACHLFTYTSPELVLNYYQLNPIHVRIIFRHQLLQVRQVNNIDIGNDYLSYITVVKMFYNM